MKPDSVPHPTDLAQLGWKPYFQQQMDLDELTDCRPGRVQTRGRSDVEVLTTSGLERLSLNTAMADLATGDWVLLDAQGAFRRRLERATLFSRKAAGERACTQHVAANVDTAFVVSSMNRDFNLNRIERYLALASEAGADRVLVLTKSDLCPRPDQFVSQAQALDPALVVVAVNGLDRESAALLLPWCGPGNTVAFLGSSGVGKSTLINTLFGRAVESTAGIREDDSKGRHTTTARTLHPLPGGGVLLDTPGMRELQLVACESGIDDVFAEISRLAGDCRFADCRHQSEPGCAVLAAVESGRVEQRRLENYRKLMREQAFNDATLAERRDRDRKKGRFYRSVMADKQHTKRGKD